MTQNISSSVILQTGCKINLMLRVGQRLENGYHAIKSLLLPLHEPHDKLEIDLLKGGVSKECRVSFFQSAPPEKAIPDIDPQRNTLTRAYAWYAEQSGFAPLLDIRVDKGVPQGAGLGGGSANAAALLLFLQEKARLAGCTPLPFAVLNKGAALVGADVPFFLLNRTAMASGVGERLVPASHPFPGYFLLLVCPPVRVSTAWAFAALDERRAAQASPEISKKLPKNLTSRQHQAIQPLAQDFGNDFEEIVFLHFPELAKLYDRLACSGAEMVRMSGTGSALFALYHEQRLGENSAKMLANEGLNVYTQHLLAG